MEPNNQLYGFGRLVLQIIGRTVEEVVDEVDEESVASVARDRRTIFLGICERSKGLDRAMVLARGTKR